MPRPLRVLIVEDREDDALLLLRALRQGDYVPAWKRVETAAEMRAAIAEEEWDVVLSDFSLPAFNALDALEVLHASGKDLPFIIVSGTIGEETAVTALKSGAHDFLVKSNLARLIPAVERAREDAAVRTSRRQAEAALRMQARQQAAVAELGQRALATTDLESLGQEATRRVAEVLQVEYAAILEFRPEEKALLVTGGTGWKAGFVGSTRIPANEWTVAGRALLTGQPIIAPDLEHDTRFRLPPQRREYGVMSALAVSIPMPNQPFGALGTYTTRPREFSQDDAHFLEAVAHVLATAIQRQRSEEQLRQAQKMEAVGLLAGGVAHDFNNLIAVITGYSELLLMRPDLSEGDRQVLEEIYHAGERAAGLTRQLLAFSRRQVLHPRVIDLNEIIPRCGKMLRRLIGEDIELAVISSAGPAHVKVDPGHIEQVLVNLVVNARDAMPQGGRITVTIERVSASRAGGPEGSADWVALSVSDTGCGMDETTQRRIFEPFFSTKASGHGTGLGLPTAQGIVQQSGGRIEMESAPGAGTTFRILLPHSALTPAAISLERSLGALPRGTETILVVEDEPRLSQLLCSTLRSAGYQVLEAASGDEALRTASGYPGKIDLLLTDVVMPGMSGREVAERLAAERPELRVAFMSGYTDDVVVRHGVAVGRAVLIQKPFTPRQLAEKLRAVLDTPAPADRPPRS
ncbi:MAG: response regulator [Armatimonadota bacterium]